MRAEKPLFVNTISAGAPRLRTADVAAAAMACSVDNAVSITSRSSAPPMRGCFSISMMIRDIASTASRG
jgi:hypothetical protein